MEGRSGGLVTPHPPGGVRLAVPARETLWGTIEFALYVAADVDRRRSVAVVGRAGTTIIDDLAELEEFDHEPWISGRVSGQIVFEALQESAGRRAVLRDDDAFPIFRDAIQSVEEVVARTVDGVREEVDVETAGRLSESVRRIFGLVLKELPDLDNPMRTPLGEEPGGGGAPFESNTAGDPRCTPRPDGEGPTLDELGGTAPPIPTPRQPMPAGDGQGAGTRARNLPSLAPDPEPTHTRSRLDPDAGTVLYNDRHADYLLVQGEESAPLDYLATLVAEEYVVYNNPRSSSDDFAEEMVRMLVRVRRHLPRRR